MALLFLSDPDDLSLSPPDMLPEIVQHLRSVGCCCYCCCFAGWSKPPLAICMGRWGSLWVIESPKT